MLDQISVVIITRNAAATLADTLESTRRFSEVLVYDNGSDDATRQIARAYENVALREGEFMGFGPTKNHAVSLARHDWVLSLDADEVVSPELTGFLEQWRPGSDSAVGVIRRDNYLMGKLVDKGGWGSDWLVRLFNRTNIASTTTQCTNRCQRRRPRTRKRSLTPSGTMRCRTSDSS